VPFKAKAACRRHIPKQRHRVTNWAEYDAALRARGSLTVWFTPEAIAAWRAEPRTTRGGQPCYSDLAITTALTLRAVFRLALRQTEGLIGSILQLLGLDLPVPDHSTLSRRAATLAVPRPKAGSEPVHLLVDSTGLKFCGPGEWLEEKHGTKRRRAWRVLHLARACKLLGVIRPPLRWASGRRSRAGSHDGDGGKRPRACRSARRCARRGRAAGSACSSASAAPWPCARR
jgi:Transposase DDE domain